MIFETFHTHHPALARCTPGERTTPCPEAAAHACRSAPSACSSAQAPAPDHAQTHAAALAAAPAPWVLLKHRSLMLCALQSDSGPRSALECAPSDGAGALGALMLWSHRCRLQGIAPVLAAQPCIAVVERQTMRASCAASLLICAQVLQSQKTSVGY